MACYALGGEAKKKLVAVLEMFQNHLQVCTTHDLTRLEINLLSVRRLCHGVGKG